MSTFGQVYASTFSGLMEYLLATYNNGANTQNVESTNAANIAMNSATNLTNYKIAQETNAANAEQAELAYKRSLPMNQMYDMMQAGLSKSAAASKIAGGGQYSPATMVGANMNAGHVEAPRLDPSLIHDAIRSFADMPQNVMQELLQREQLENVKQQRELALNEDRRKQQDHDLSFDEKLYSKKQREDIDNWSSKLANVAQEKNLFPSQNESYEEYVRALGLQDDELYKNMTASARQRGFEVFKQHQEEQRSQDENRRKEQAQQDAHLMQLLSRRELQQKIDDYKSEKNARQKEYRARELNADLAAIAAEFGIAKSEYDQSCSAIRDNNGKLHLTPMVQGSRALNMFWNTVFDSFPLDALSNAIFKGIKIGK